MGGCYSCGCCRRGLCRALCGALQAAENAPTAARKRRAARGAAPPPALVCMGDSLTNGWCSADYLRGLRQRFGAGVDVVNAGINGDMAYNLLQRADDTVALDGVAGIVVLIGTNDMLGSLRYVRPPLGNLRVDNTITRLRAQATTPPPYKSCVC